MAFRVAAAQQLHCFSDLTAKVVPVSRENVSSEHVSSMCRERSRSSPWAMLWRQAGREEGNPSVSESPLSSFAQAS